jgi:thiol-disulfide isomerase/thioredoxin
VKRLLWVMAALTAAAAGFATHQALRAPAPPQDLALAAIEFTDLDGNPRSLAQWQGKVILLNFWATWCPPCRAEIPLFIALQDRYGAEGLQVVGVAVDRTEAVTRYRHEVGINYPLLLGEKTAAEVMRRYGNIAGALPYSVVIDREGHSVASKLGAYTASELEQQVLPALRKRQIAGH